MRRYADCNLVCEVELQVMARSSDEALMLARLKDEGYNETQRV